MRGAGGPGAAGRCGRGWQWMWPAGGAAAGRFPDQPGEPDRLVCWVREHSESRVSVSARGGLSEPPENEFSPCGPGSPERSGVWPARFRAPTRTPNPACQMREPSRCVEKGQVGGISVFRPPELSVAPPPGAQGLARALNQSRLRTAAEVTACCPAWHRGDRLLPQRSPFSAQLPKAMEPSPNNPETGPERWGRTQGWPGPSGRLSARRAGTLHVLHRD